MLLLCTMLCVNHTTLAHGPIIRFLSLRSQASNTISTPRDATLTTLYTLLGQPKFSCYLVSASLPCCCIHKAVSALVFMGGHWMANVTSGRSFSCPSQPHIASLRHLCRLLCISSSLSSSCNAFVRPYLIRILPISPLPLRVLLDKVLTTWGNADIVY